MIVSITPMVIVVGMVILVRLIIMAYGVAINCRMRVSVMMCTTAGGIIRVVVGICMRVVVV